MSFKYKYESGLKKGERQYDRYYDLKTENILKAISIKAIRISRLYQKAGV